MKHFGDITKINGRDLPVVDCVTCGSPCQDLSIAGQKAGLEGERSGLFFEAIRVVKELREYDRQTNGHMGIYVRPRYFVFENVPGALSSGKPYGEDFRIILEQIAQIADPNAVVPRPSGGEWTSSGVIMADRWSIAWRIHNAEFWGVAQRRRRLSIVADFGEQSAPEILFERKSLRRDLEPSGKTGEGTSRTVENGTFGTNFTLKIRGGVGHDAKGRTAGKGALIQKELSGTLGVLQDQTVFCIQGNAVDRPETANTNGSNWKADSSYTLNTIDRPAIAYRKQGHPMNKEMGKGWEEAEVNDTLNISDNTELRTPTIIATKVYSVGNGQMNQISMSDKAGALNCMHDQQAILSISSSNCNSEKEYRVMSQDGTDDGNSPKIGLSSVVRRLTPTECERLQGFPDGWTDIEEWTDTKGKKHKSTDSARFKAIGNSIATPFWYWLLRRISEQYTETPTLGSLFDGIGGFPYCWERVNGKGSAVWASEIEEFPIAVTRYHFPDGEEEHEQKD